jgi:hypothetical protein
VGHFWTFLLNSVVTEQRGVDSNSAIQNGTSFFEEVCKFHDSAHFKHRTFMFTYKLLTKFTHQDGPLIQ